MWSGKRKKIQPWVSICGFWTQSCSYRYRSICHRLCLLLSHNYACWVGILWIYLYHSLPIIPFAHLFEPKVGRGLITECLVSLDYMPPQTCGCSEIIRWLSCGYPGEQQQHWSCTTTIFPSVLVRPTEEITCSHQWWQETEGNWVIHTCVYIFRGQWKC